MAFRLPEGWSAPEPIEVREDTEWEAVEPDPRSFGISTIEYCSLLPKRRHSHTASGLVLLLPRVGLVVVPYEAKRGGSWACVVVAGNQTYGREGYSIEVCSEEVETAVQVQLSMPLEWTAAHARSQVAER